MEVEMEIDPAHTSESRARRPAEDLEESFPFVARKKVKNPEPVGMATGGGVEGSERDALARRPDRA
jgi:hypothetical protein